MLSIILLILVAIAVTLGFLVLLAALQSLALQYRKEVAEMYTELNSETEETNTSNEQA